MSDILSALDIRELTIDKTKLYDQATAEDANLMAVLLDEFNGRPSPYFSGLLPGMVPRTHKWIVYRDVAVHLLTAYEETGLEKWSHAEQRRVLEKAIRLLEKAAGGETGVKPGEPDVALHRGKAFLYRSRIVKPKGLTVPGKKIEALEKAMALLKTSGAAEAPHYLGLTALEMDRCGVAPAPEEMVAILDEAVRGKPGDNRLEPKRVEYWRMRTRLAEFKPDVWHEEDASLIFAERDDKLNLEKMKTAILGAGKPPKTLAYYRKQLIETLRELPFSHPLWDDTVRFLRRIHKLSAGDQIGQTVTELFEKIEKSWPELAQELWQTAEEQSRTLADIHLRWYWSRQRDLYDLAFLSAVKADDLCLAARIADSVKSRPALTWQAIERMGYSDTKLPKNIEQFARALGGGYVKNMSLQTAGEPIQVEFPSNAPDGLLIVQFYLVHLKDFDKGYALTCDSNGWSASHSFDFTPIWRNYIKWQTAYFDLPSADRKKSSEFLLKLCEALGDCLEFLFNITDESDLLMIPHDFLHRVPLHGAILTNQSEDLDEHRMLIEHRRCAFWPTVAEYGGNGVNLSADWGRVQYFDPEKEIAYIEHFKELDTLFATNELQAGVDELNGLCRKRPGLLVILCHGKADVTNPFFSELRLKKTLSVLELTAMKENLAGSSVFLGACEADVMPAIDSPLDEHYSPALAMIGKGAPAVIGTLWEASRDDVITILKNLKRDRFEAIFKHQRDLWENYVGGEGAEHLYDGLVFKLYCRRPKR